MSQATMEQLTTPGAIDPWKLQRFPFGDQLPDEQGIYFVLYKAEVLYIGMTNSFFKRWEKHHRSDELKALSGVEVACCPVYCDRATLYQIEQRLIAWMSPVLNGRKVTKCRQGHACQPLIRPTNKGVEPGARTIMLDWTDVYVKTNSIEYAEMLDGELFSRAEVKAIIEDRYDWAARVAEDLEKCLQKG